VCAGDADGADVDDCAAAFDDVNVEVGGSGSGFACGASAGFVSFGVGAGCGFVSFGARVGWRPGWFGFGFGCRVVRVGWVVGFVGFGFGFGWVGAFAPVEPEVAWFGWGSVGG
jgi:hypothetical protein